MIQQELNTYIESFSEAYVSHCNDLSIAIGNNSCLQKKMSLKAFIMRNYIRMLSNFELIPTGINYVSYIINDINIDSLIPDSSIDVIVDYNSNQFTLTYPGMVYGTNLAIDIASLISTIADSTAEAGGNHLNIFSSDQINLSITINYTSSSTSLNLIEADSKYAEESYFNKYNTLEYSSINQIISAMEMIIKTKCKCN